MTSGEHDRSGGVRGAINDLLGRGDRHDEHDADRREDPDTTPGLNADQPFGGAVHGEQVPGGQADYDRPLADQHYGDGASSTDTGERIGDPDTRERDTFAAGSQVPAPRGEASLEGVTTDPRVNPDVPAASRLDAPPPGQAGPRHELFGQGDSSGGAAVAAEHGVESRSAENQGTENQGAENQGVANHSFENQGAENDGTVAGQASETTDRPGTDRLTGAAAGGPAVATSGSDRSPASAGTDEEGRERLVPAQRASEYGTRWDQIKGDFVDEPRRAVSGADALVGELLDELQTLFADQRHGLDRGLDADETSTEDLRLALRRYRSFFDRLLSI